MVNTVGLTKKIGYLPKFDNGIIIIKNKKKKIKITVATKYSHSIEKLRKKI